MATIAEAAQLSSFICSHIPTACVAVLLLDHQIQHPPLSCPHRCIEPSPHYRQNTLDPPLLTQEHRTPTQTGLATDVAHGTYAVLTTVPQPAIPAQSVAH